MYKAYCSNLLYVCQKVLNNLIIVPHSLSNGNLIERLLYFHEATNEDSMQNLETGRLSQPPSPVIIPPSTSLPSAPPLSSFPPPRSPLPSL